MCRPDLIGTVLFFKEPISNFLFSESDLSLINEGIPKGVLNLFKFLFTLVRYCFFGLLPESDIDLGWQAAYIRV